MKTLIILSTFLLISLASSQTINKDYGMMKDIVKLCSKFCASRPEPKCPEDKPAVYAPMDEIVDSKSPGDNVQVDVNGDRVGGPSLVDGHKGKAIYLPNSGTYDNNYLDLGRFAGQCINNVDKCDNGYTVSFWYKVANGNHRWPVLASASDWQIWSQDAAAGNAPYISWFKNDGRRYVMGGTKGVSNEEWHQVAIVAKSRTEVKMYIDGEMIADELRRERAEHITIKDIEFGCYKERNCIAAAFDEVKIWEEAKTDAEVKAIFLSKKRR